MGVDGITWMVLSGLRAFSGRWLAATSAGRFLRRGSLDTGMTETSVCSGFLSSGSEHKRGTLPRRAFCLALSFAIIPRSSFDERCKMGTAVGRGFDGWVEAEGGFAGTIWNFTLDGLKTEFSVTSLGRLTTGAWAVLRGSTTCTASQGVGFKAGWWHREWRITVSLLGDSNGQYLQTNLKLPAWCVWRVCLCRLVSLVKRTWHTPHGYFLMGDEVVLVLLGGSGGLSVLSGGTISDRDASICLSVSRSSASRLGSVVVVESLSVPKMSHR